MAEKAASPEIYPLNMLLAAKGNTRVELPPAFTEDVRAGVRFVLSTLEERDRRVLRLRYEQLLPQAEAAAALQISQEQFRKWESRALNKLRIPSRWNFMRYGIQGYLRRSAETEFHRGYTQGYKAGYQNGADDIRRGTMPKGPEEEVRNLPIENLGLSVRAYHCLQFGNYHRIGDLLNLDEHSILCIRNMGRITAGEIAQALYDLGIRQTAWDNFLLE